MAATAEVAFRKIMTQYTKYASVVLDVAIDKALDYGVQSQQIQDVYPGVRVKVPVRGHLREGIVTEIKEQSSFDRVLPITKIVSRGELVTKPLFELAYWMARYYCAPLRQVLKTILPASIRKNTEHKQQLFVMRATTRQVLLDECVKARETSASQAAVLEIMLKVKKGILLTELLEQTGTSRSPVNTLVKRGLLTIDIVRVDRSPLVGVEFIKTKPKVLNDQQAKALRKICGTLDAEQYETHLLFGVTGSGKTEVYLQAIDRALSKNKGVIVLVPEISLTPQTIERFRSRFEGHIAILHHRLSQGERFDEWHKIHRGEAKIVIGARSAIFSPVPNLGLIIVDEEHEQSYKQSEERPCYHARDLAVMRGRFEQAAVILGSATPSLESYYNAQTGKYTLSVLKSRANAASLPQVSIIDMKREHEKAKRLTLFSDALIKKIKDRQDKGEQSLLFLNRRGYHSSFMCSSCGKAVECPHCDLALKFHRHESKLSCHLCGFTLKPPPRECPSCGGSDPMKFRGAGTEQAERTLHAILPDIRTIRLDADTTRHKGSHQKLLQQFRNGKADILIGTQMIAKGLHFPQVTLVGVLNSDASLNIPDFRSSETVFQLITQVSGRAGRGATSGEVLIQTNMPDNNTIRHAAHQDFEAFYTEEVAVRQMFDYPPFSRMAKCTFSGKDEKKTERFAQMFWNALRQRLSPEFQLHPVAPSGYAKIKDNYRFQFLVMGKKIYSLTQAIGAVLQGLEKANINVNIDIDPSSTYF